MGNDINSLVARYLQNNSDADMESIKKAINNLKPEDRSAGSVFELSDFSGSMSEDDFLTLMSSFTGKSEASIKDDVGILFDILDNEEDGVGSLSKEELSQLSLNSGNTDEVSAFSVWNRFIEFSEDKVSDVDLSKLGSSGSEVVSTEGTGSTGGTEGTTGKTDGDTQVDDGNTPGSTPSLPDFDINDPESVKKHLDDFLDEDHKTYESVIQYLLDSELISEDMASQITAAITKTGLTPEEQARVDAAIAMNPDLTEEEAIEKLGLGKSEDTSALTEVRYKEIDAEQWADDIFDSMEGLGTKNGKLEALLTDTSISDEDFAKIVEAYEKKYGQGVGNVGLVTRIEQDTSGDLQAKLTGVLGARLLEAAKKGDETAIDMLCKEIYSGTAGQVNTANDFLDSVFNTDDDELLYKINKRYSEINKGRDLVKDIKNDHSGVLGWRNWFGWNVDASGNGQSYIDKIESAVRHHRE